VLSTLHTNDAPGTVSRLLNMGIEPFMVTVCNRKVLAQRLARKVCKDCAAPVDVDAKTLFDVGFTEAQVAQAGGKHMKGAGCKTCNGSGYKGRVALYEVMRFNDSLKQMVLEGAPTAELKLAAIKSGMSTLRMSGIKKVTDGVTTPEEIVRVTMAD